MIHELVALAARLPADALAPPGYYHFGVPVRLEVHLHRDGRLGTTVHPAPDGPMLPRPENGRTSGDNARLIADMAKAVQPGPALLHSNYLAMLGRALDHPELQHPDVRRAVGQLVASAQDGRLAAALTQAAPGDKDWISFTATVDGRREHLIAHPEVQRTWMALLTQELSATTSAGEARQGECASCGQFTVLARRSAVKIGVNPAKLVPITSLNQSAFLSGETDFKRASIALCLTCTDTATRTLNWLLTTAPHHQYVHLASRKGQGEYGSSKTVRAVAWLGDPELLDDLQEPLALITGPDDTAGALPFLTLPPSEADLQRLWDIPFSRGRPDHVAVGEQDFHLLLLSPTQGHIIFRSHHTLRLRDLQAHLQRYQRRTALPVLGEDDTPRLPSQRDMTEAALRLRDQARVAREDPQAGLVRAGLLQHAYLGSPPPQSLLLPALHAFQEAIRRPEPGLAYRLRLHALACALTLYRSDMDETVATLSGRLLAVIERAQQDSQRRQYGRANDHTIATRTISAAASRPSHVLGQLIPLATRAYLPRARYHQPRFAELSAALLDLGVPKRLSPHQQAEFSLGYYAEVHRLSQRRAPTPSTPDVPQEDQP